MLQGLVLHCCPLRAGPHRLARRSNDSAAAWRVLAIVLTVLFFEKANYYLLIAAPLALAAFCEQPRFWIDEARGLLRRVSVSSLAGKAVCDPILLLAAAVFGVVIYLHWRGPGAVVVFGRSLSLYPLRYNLVTVGYALLFVRAAMAWRAHRAAIMPGSRRRRARAVRLACRAAVGVVSAAAPAGGAALVCRAPTFPDPEGGLNLTHALQVYGPALFEGFHVALWAAACAVLFFCRPGAIEFRPARA